MEMNKLLEDYGCLAFSDDVMKERIPKSIYKAFHASLDKGVIIYVSQLPTDIKV